MVDNTASASSYTATNQALLLIHVCCCSIEKPTAAAQEGRQQWLQCYKPGYHLPQEDIAAIGRWFLLLFMLLV